VVEILTKEKNGKKYFNGVVFGKEGNRVKYKISKHFAIRMYQRHTTIDDVVECLKYGEWKREGYDIYVKYKLMKIVIGIHPETGKKVLKTLVYEKNILQKAKKFAKKHKTTVWEMIQYYREWEASA